MPNCSCTVGINARSVLSVATAKNGTVCTMSGREKGASRFLEGFSTNRRQSEVTNEGEKKSSSLYGINYYFKMKAMNEPKAKDNYNEQQR